MRDKFRVLLRLRTPVVVTDFAPTLDGMLYAAAYAQTGSNIGAQAVLRDALDFDEQHGVYCASSLWFGLDMSAGLSIQRYIRTDCLANKLDSEMFQASQRAGKFSLINLQGGPTKRRLQDRPAYAAPTAVFFGRGDADLVFALLDYYRPGVGYDAASGGMGAYDTVEVSPIDNDYSLFWVDGTPNRPLPAAQDGVVTTAVLVPPYYEKHRMVPADLPDRIRATMLSNLK